MQIWPEATFYIFKLLSYENQCLLSQVCRKNRGRGHASLFKVLSKVKGDWIVHHTLCDFPFGSWIHARRGRRGPVAELRVGARGSAVEMVKFKAFDRIKDYGV